MNLSRDVDEVVLADVEGVRCLPADDHRGVGALILAGSSGRVDVDRAHVFAGVGVLSESVRWFGGAGQHAGPWEIPIEFFLERISGLRRECDRVVVVGTSFGAEAALVAGAISDEVDAVVAFAPSDVVWAGVTDEGRVTSHWTHRGEVLPFVRLAEDWEPDEEPPAFVGAYLRSRQVHADDVPAATISVESIPEVILIAGGDDRVWPSVDHAERIGSTRAEHGMDTVIVTDGRAGHRTILPGEVVVHGGMLMQRGGTEDADRLLGRRAWESIVGLVERLG